MKNNKTLIITSIILLSCIAIGLLIFMIFGMNGKFAFYGTGGKLVDSKIYQDLSLNNINIDVKSYDLKIEESTNDEISVEIYGNEKTKNNIEITNNNGELKIKQSKSTICFGFCFNSSHIIVKIPRSYEGTYNINTISGEITSFVTFRSTNNKVSSTSGDITLSNLNHSKVKSTSGNIKINTLENSEVKTTSGDIELTSVKDCDVTSTSGEIEIESYLGKGDIETTSGDIRINSFEIEGNTNISSTSGDIKMKLLNEAYIYAESVSGDKNIRKSRGDYELNLKTISGDITVR